MLFYSKSTNGFYDDAIHAPEQIPADRVPVSREDHRLMMEGQAKGHVWQPAEDGQPVIVGRPGPTAEEHQAIIAGHAKRELARTDYHVVRAYEQGASVDPAVAAYRESLRDVVRGNLSQLPQGI